MLLPIRFQGLLTAPVIVAPMFLVSGVDLVTAACRSGFVGTFPSLNQRSTAGYEAWLSEIRERLSAFEVETGTKAAPFGVNLVVHRSNSRLEADLEATVRHRVPLVITSLGADRDVVAAIHSYGGLVFHDVINVRHARKAAEAGVDGLIAVAAGAGGHAGSISPFALVSEIRSFFDGTIVLSGAMSEGRHIAAARIMGADLAYMGTRFIATRESLAAPAFKSMILDAHAADIVYTPAVSGVAGNFLRPSLIAAGRDPDDQAAGPESGMHLEGEARVWKDIWSAGQGVGAIRDIPATADLCARLTAEYHEALRAI